MIRTIPVLSALICLSPAMTQAADTPPPVVTPALSTPKLDLLGGAAFTESYLTISVNSTEAEERSSKQDFSALHIGVGAYSISGYSSRPERDMGGLLGVGLQARTWVANDRDIEWTAVAPFILIVGGVYLDPAKDVRLALLAEAGPGIAFDRIESHGVSENKGFRPAFHFGVQATAMMRLQPKLEAGLIFGYDFDRMPNVDASGPLFGIVVRIFAN